MADVVTGIVSMWQCWTGGLFNYFQLCAQPLEQPWGSDMNLWDLRVTDTPKTRGIDQIANSPPAPLSAGWPAPLVQHNLNVSLYVGYYSKDGLPNPTPVTSRWLPFNTVMHYLVRFATPCVSSINAKVAFSSSGGELLEVSQAVGSFLPSVNITTSSSNGTSLVSSSALFPPLSPSSALSSGLVTVRLKVPVAGVQYKLWYFDASCR